MSELEAFQRELKKLRRIRELEAKFEANAARGIGEEPVKKVATGDKLKDAAKAGLASTFAAPGLLVDAVNWPLKKMGIGSERPFLGSDYIYDGVARKLGVQHYQPEDDAERYAMGVAQAGGAAAPIVLPLAAYAAATGGLAAGATALGVGGASAVTGGVGSQFGGELAAELGGESARPTGELLGGVIGGQSPYTAATLAAKSGNKFANTLSKDAQTKAAEVQAKKELGKYLDETPDLPANIAMSEQVAQKVPGMEIGLAGRTQSPGVQAIARNLESTDPQALNLAMQRSTKNEQALEAFKAKALQANQSVTEPAQKVLQSSIGKVEGRIKEIDALEQQLTERFPRGEQKIVGQGLTKLRNEREALVRQQKNALYEDVYQTADAQQLRVPLPGLVSGIKNEMKKEKYSPQSIPSVYSRVLEVTGGKGQYEPSFREFHDLVKATGRELGMARQGTDARLVGRLEKLYGGLQSKLKEYEQVGGEVSSKLAKANQFYNDKYRTVFKEGVGGLMARDNRWGQVTPEEDIVRNLVFKTNNAEGVEEFFKIYGDDPATRADAFKLLREGVVDIFSRDVVKDGAINPRAAENFFKKYKQSLDRLPGIKAELQDGKRVQDILLERRAQQQQAIKELNGSWVAKIANTSEDKVPALIASAMEDKKTLLRMSNLANRSPEGKKAIAYEVARHVETQPDPYAYVLAKKEYLTPLLGKEHVDNIMTLAAGRKIVAAEKPSSNLHVSTTQEDAAKKTLGSSLTAIQSRLRSVAEGRSSAGYAISDIASKFALRVKESHLRELYKQAIYDPDIAKTLAEINRTPKITEKQIFQLRGHLFSLGMRAASEMTDEDLPDAGDEK